MVAGFLANLNIFNSDNYRYLVFLLVPWSLGFGLGMDDLWRRGAKGRLAAGLAATLPLAGGMTIAAFRWYRETRHYLDDRGLPVRREGCGLVGAPGRQGTLEPRDGDAEAPAARRGGDPR